MSENFTGVTFAMQKVTPSDDASVRRAALRDGMLSGCAISYSGSTLTMGPGQLLACGRQFNHPSTQNWPVVDATSGFARLVLTIDLTRTATKDAFDQVVDTIQYASSLDGFPALEQSDINSSGTRYQIVVCVVSLGPGGISGIVFALGKCTPVGSDFRETAFLGDNPVSIETDTPANWIALGDGFATVTTPCTIEQCVQFGTIINRITDGYYVQQLFIAGNGVIEVRAGNKEGGWFEHWTSVFNAGYPIVLKENVHYGPNFPSGAEKGTIFWIPRGSVNG